jgi:cytochrome b
MNEAMKSVGVWDIFVRTFHWTLLGTVIALFVTGETFEGVHFRIGYFLTGLVLARIIWGFIGTKHARFKDFLYKPAEIYRYLTGLLAGNPTHYRGHNPAGGLMIVVLLASLLLTAFTGLMALGSQGQGPLADAGNSILRPAYADEDDHDEKNDSQAYSQGHGGEKQKDEFWQEIHESLTGFIIFLIAVHLAGVLVSSWIHRENLILGMITGKKE